MEDRFNSLMAEAGLSGYADAVRGLIRNSIRITSQPASEGDFKVGQSRLGGVPDLPPGLEWPTWMSPGYPWKPSFFQRLLGMRPTLPQEPALAHLPFIAQFNLSEVAPYDTEKVLPDHGMLYFFFDSNPMVWADDPPHKEGWRVIYWDGDTSQLARASAPEGLSQKHIYGTFRPSFTSERMFPSYDSLLLERLGMSQDEIDRYSEVIEELLPDYDDETSRLLGHPDYMQPTDMLTECQLAHNGIPSRELQQLRSDPQKADLLKGAADWQLLFQVDSGDLDLDTEWGDAGRIYYFTRSFDMTTQSLDEVQLALQCG